MTGKEQEWVLTLGFRLTSKLEMYLDNRSCSSNLNQIKSYNHSHMNQHMVKEVLLVISFNHEHKKMEIIIDLMLL